MVRRVVLTVGERTAVVCPVCLQPSSRMRVPQITMCGHVYCWPCVLMHCSRCNSQRVNQASRKDQCPICNEWMSKDELRDCDVVVRQQIELGEIATLVLRLREPNSAVICLPATLEEDKQLARYLRVERQYLAEKTIQQQAELLRCQEECRSEGDVQRLPFVKEAMDANAKHMSQLSEPAPVAAGKSTNSLFLRGLGCQESEAIHFYQEQFGRTAFLHPICHKYLLQQQKEGGQLPVSLESLVVWKQSIHLDEKHLRRYKYLNHLPENDDVHFLELDMKPFLKEEFLVQFQKDMEKHRSRLHEKEEAENKKLEEMQAKRAIKKQRLRTSEEFWMEKPTTQLTDLKDMDRQQHFPELISQSSQQSFLEQLSSQSSIHEAAERPKQQPLAGGGLPANSQLLEEKAIYTAPADSSVPQGTMQSAQLLPSKHEPLDKHSKKRKRRRQDNQDVTSLFFESES